MAAIEIRSVTVIDGTGRPAQADQTVLIDGDRIVAIRDHAIPAPAGATVIDGRGKFLIPGLFDTHIHLEGGRSTMAPTPDRTVAMKLDVGRRMLHGYLYNGVTTVYDAANYDKFIFTMRSMERSGEMVSPHIFATGYLITRAGGYGASGGGVGVNTYEEGVKALDTLFAEKPDLVKFSLAPHNAGFVRPDPPVLDPLLLHRLLMYSEEHGFRTTIHAVEADTEREAVEAGITALAHPVYMTATDDKLAPLIAARGLPVSTTLVVLQNIFRIVDDPSFFDTPAFRDTLADSDIAHYRDEERERYRSTGLDKWAREAFAYASTNVRKLYDAGATLALGTDRTIGGYVPQELELLVGLGIPPLQALRIGTLNAATYLNKQESMGSIQEGKIADVVLLNADPTQNIGNVRAISTVIVGGKIVDRTKLDLPINHRPAGK